MRWIRKRSESLRLHQDRRWKWMDTKDQVVQRYRNASPKVWICRSLLGMWHTRSQYSRWLAQQPLITEEVQLMIWYIY